MKEYILFCAQEANFQTRSMLIPVEHIDSKLESELDILDRYARKCLFRTPGGNIIVDKVLTLSSIWDVDCGEQISTPFSNITGTLMFIADEYMLNGPLTRSGWDMHTIRPIEVGCGFDHLSNFVDYMNIAEYDGVPISVIDGYLVLDGSDLPINQPETIELEPKLKSGEIMLFPKNYEGEWLE